MKKENNIHEQINENAALSDAISIGLPHLKDAAGRAVNVKGQPGIMTTVVNSVDDAYRETFVEKGYFESFLNRDKRKVTQDDINKLGLDKLKFNTQGKAELGSKVNKYHAREKSY